jgi:hypothetical protein
MQLALSAEHIEKPLALPQWAAAILGDFIARDRWRAVSPRRPIKPAGLPAMRR